MAALREFEEELGVAPAAGPARYLGEIRQKGGKLVSAWALEGDLDASAIVSNTFPLQWPPRSGQWIQVPEVDRAQWFGLDEARKRINPAQAALLDRLLEGGEEP
jgi:predicted NUDIX family NTP pyrophosphohydrolase